jgi:zinc/manganese transport system permease protein
MDPLLLYPFLACLLLVSIHAYFGLHILQRGIIFVDLALAQFIGVGMALAFYFGQERSALLPLAAALVGSGVLAMGKRLSRYVNLEAFIGVLYIFSISAAILILDKAPHGFEEFRNILNGNILWVMPQDLLNTFFVYLAIGFLHFILRKQFLALSYENRGGYGLEFIFFLSFAIVLVKSVQLAGILQVFAFLVIPALIGRLFFTSPMKILLTGWSAGTIASMAGVWASYTLDIPTAPVIVAGLAGVFFLLLAGKSIFRKLENQNVKK